MPLVITEAELQAARDVLASNPKIGRETLSRILGCTESRARTILQRLAISGEKQVHAVPQQPAEQNEINGDSWTISLAKTRICTLEALIAYCQIDTSEWEVERWVCNKWEVGAKDASDQIQIEPLFQVKAWLKRKSPVALATKAGLEELLDEIRARGPIYPRLKPSKSPSGNMVEISIPDAHFGKLAWSPETGWENYDSRIAEREFRDAFGALLQRISAYKFDRVLLVPGNDFLNANNRENTTAGGTPQNCDGRQQKTFRLACKTTIWTIESALEIAPVVDVLPIQGNHDPDAIFYLSEVLAAWFRNCDRVKIDTAPTQRKFYQWGQVGLMFTHKGGKGEKRTQRNRLLMATERREMWGNTKFNEIHTGDLHQVRLEEEFGVRVRILPSLCPPDAWHSQEGYVGNIRSAEAYIWNRDEGLLGTAIYNVPNQQPQNAVCLGA